MTKLILKFFLSADREPTDPAVREQVGKVCGAVSIFFHYI